MVDFNRLLRIHRGETWLRQLAALLNIDRPLISLDLETTGVSPEVDRIFQIGLLKAYPLGVAPPGVEPADIDPEKHVVKHWSTYVDPQVPVPMEVCQVCKITPDRLDGAPLFKDIARGVLAGFEGCDFIGYSVRQFDFKFMEAAFAREGLTWDRFGPRVIDAKNIYFWAEPRDLSAAVKRWPDEDTEGFANEAHDALVDACSVAPRILGQLREFPNLPRTVQELHDFCFPQKDGWLDEEGKIVWRGSEACIGFGKKWRGVSLRQMAADKSNRRDTGRSYFKWMLSDPGFSSTVKRIVQDALDDKFPIRTGVTE